MLLSRRAALAALMLGPSIARARAAPEETPHIQWPPPTSLAGTMLVSAPGQDDGPFGRSVVFLIVHAATGAMGVIVNKPLLEESLSHMLEATGDARPPGTVPKIDVAVHYGGPVESEALLVVHSPDLSVDRTKRVSALAAVSPAQHVLDALAGGKGPQRFVFFTGYAGWAPGQLEAEIAKSWWIKVPAAGDILYGGADAGKWQRAYDSRPIDL